MILGVGVVDDRYGLRGRHKLAGQVVAAAILVGLGLRIDAWSGFGVEVELGIFAYPITVLWILLVVNAFNLIDGMDGFCGSLGLVASLAIAFLAFWSGRVEDTIVGLALAGALAAFLRDNLPPARVYLGDAGSMTLGMMIAALSVRACSDGPDTAVSLPPLVALLALPLLDVATALGRRWLTGRSLFTPDRGHIHHRLRSRLGSTAAALGAARRPGGARGRRGRAGEGLRHGRPRRLPRRRHLRRPARGHEHLRRVRVAAPAVPAPDGPGAAPGAAGRSGGGASGRSATSTASGTGRGCGTP